MNSSTAIITGVPGWLGNRFVRGILDGLPDVLSLSRPQEREIRLLVKDDEDKLVRQLQADPRVQIVKGDLRDKASLRSLLEKAPGSTVFHIAGVIHPGSVREFFEINEQGTKNLLEQAIASGARRFVYVSSNSPIGTNPNKEHRFDENSPYNPYMGYGKSKMLAELALRAAADKIETVILRPPWFYGPGQPPRQLLFFTMIKNGKVPIVGNGDNMRSMAYVDNICQSMLLAETVQSASNQIFWIADRKPYSMNEIVSVIENLLEKEFGMTVAHKRVHLPDLASDVAMAVDAALQSAGLYNQKIHVLSEMNKNIACSIAKAEAALGYDPQIALEEGMRRSIRSALDAGMKI